MKTTTDPNLLAISYRLASNKDNVDFSKKGWWERPYYCLSNKVFCPHMNYKTCKGSKVNCKKWNETVKMLVAIDG